MAKIKSAGRRMSMREVFLGVPVPEFVPALLGLLIVAPLSLLHAQGSAGGARIIERGQPPVVIHATVGDAIAAREAHGPFGGGGSTNLSYHGGTGGIGVETAPKIYLVLWGSQWNNNDPSGEASILQNFYSGVGSSSWLNSVTQYCQGVASGTVFCNGAGQAAGNQASMLGGFGMTTQLPPRRVRRNPSLRPKP
jgi:hypothetical protein